MHVLAIDQGTTGTTTALYDTEGRLVAKAYREFPQIYPRPGWVEHDANAIWDTLVATVREVLDQASVSVAAVGITNQRETTVLWRRSTGEPIHNAIVWQCRRTAGLCEGLAEHAEVFRARTGLPLDAYFSGTKIKWLLDHAVECPVDDLLFGTIDTWLIWKLTGGKQHATDYTNASRTLLFDIHRRTWDAELCGLLDIPVSILPDVRTSVGDYGVVEAVPELAGVPICGVAGDQQAALFGHACFSRGQIKNTYGTGCFLIINTGGEPIESHRGLITTLAVDGRGEPCYALEGSVFIGGAVIQWLRDGLGVLACAADSEQAAVSVRDTGGVYLVPAFAGLGAPHWDMHARGTIVGLTSATKRVHLIRAALESMAYQTRDVFVSMEAETGLCAERLAVDGGASANDFLMQFQADLLDRPVVRPATVETTSLGAAYLAGLRAGVWANAGEISELTAYEREFRPQIDPGWRGELLRGWEKALRQTMAR